MKIKVIKLVRRETFFFLTKMELIKEKGKYLLSSEIIKRDKRKSAASGNTWTLVLGKLSHNFNAFRVILIANLTVIGSVSPVEIGVVIWILTCEEEMRKVQNLLG